MIGVSHTNLLVKDVYLHILPFLGESKIISCFSLWKEDVTSTLSFSFELLNYLYFINEMNEHVSVLFLFCSFTTL